MVTQNKILISVGALLVAFSLVAVGFVASNRSQDEPAPSVLSEQTTPGPTDTTPPSPNLTIEELPDTVVKSDTLHIRGTTPELNTIVLINDQQYPVDENGNFQADYFLSEGENTLSFKLADQVGNATEVITTKKIVVDSLPPKITTSLFCEGPSGNIFEPKPGEETVCVTTGQFSGPLSGTAQAPIVGRISPGVSVTVDGKKIIPDEEGVVYQRISLYLRQGTNKFRVEATDAVGNIARDYITVNWEDQSYSRASDVLDQLDDIESRIGDLE